MNNFRKIHPYFRKIHPFRGLETHTNGFFEIEKRKYNLNENFCTYLAGLIEGGGSIILPKEERLEKNRKNYPSVQICFHLKNLPLLLTLQKELSFGSINRKKGEDAYIYTINSIEELTLLSFCIYCYMRTPKIYDLSKLIDWLKNQKKKNNNFHIRKRQKRIFPQKDSSVKTKTKSLKKKNSKYTIYTHHLLKVGSDESPLLENASLSGFIEADGHFKVKASLSSYKIQCRMEIVQSTILYNNISKKDFLEKIAYITHSIVKTTKQTKRNFLYRVRTLNIKIKGNLVCKEYLQKYPSPKRGGLD